MYQKGKNAELTASLAVHQSHLPLLVSSIILRKRHCGQIDLACFKSERLVIFEIKKRNLGREQLSSRQKIRLMSSGDFLGKLLSRSVDLRVWDF